MAKTYRIGVIGAGARGETFARKLYAGLSRASLFGVCDQDGDRLVKFCDYCGLSGATTFTDPHEFLAHPEMDALIITTPEFTHADVAIEAMAAGKHVYLEKPLAHTMDDCYRLVEAEGAHPDSVAFVGFNMRESTVHPKLKEVVESGVLGQIVHIEGLEQLAQAHGAAFMRRWHRRSERSGGMLNTKCSHDMDMMQWLIGHEHKVVRIASFGGNSIFDPSKAPATHCSRCPVGVRDACPYRDQAGFVFPVGGDEPIHKVGDDAGVYGLDMCVYNADKDIVDNQTVIFEWDNGVRGNFNLQLLQAHGLRETRIWGERGLAVLRTDSNTVTLTASDTGNVTEIKLARRRGGHGGSDPRMLSRFIWAIDHPGKTDSGISHGLAATLLALKADESRLSGEVVEIDPSEYAARPATSATR